MGPLTRHPVAGSRAVLRVRALLLAALLVALFSATACQSGSGEIVEPTRPPLSQVGHSIGTGSLSGDKTTTVDLGTHLLGEQVWVSLVLTGPENASAKFTLRVESDDGDSTYGASRGPIDATNIGDVYDPGLRIDIDEPGAHRITFRQVVRPEEAPGYSVEYDVRTTP